MLKEVSKKAHYKHWQMLSEPIDLYLLLALHQILMRRLHRESNKHFVKANIVPDLLCFVLLIWHIHRLGLQ